MSNIRAVPAATSVETGRSPSPASRPGIVSYVAICAIVAGLIGQLWIDWRVPLWLDEGFTAAIAESKSAKDLIAWCLEDPNAPLYYGFIWLWSHLFGVSGLALRLPSVVFSLAATLLVAWKGHDDKDTRLCWAALFATWQPGWQFASDARCYAMLALLCVAQTIYFVRFVDRRRRADLWGWSIAGALAGLTHYYALIPVALQGLMLIGWRFRPLVRNWLALSAFVPVCAWLAIHFSHLVPFAAPETSWYHLMDANQAARLAVMAFGVAGMPIGLAFSATLIVQIARAARKRVAWPYTAGETMVAASAFAALAIVIIAAFFKPMLTDRYLVPMAPPAILGLVLWARQISRGTNLLLLALLAISAGSALAVVRTGTRDFITDRYGYNFEQPSAWLRAHRMRRFVFFWDHPAAGLYAPHRLIAMGAGFLSRDGWRGPAEAIVLNRPDTDPNQVLSAVASRSGDGILWAYDDHVGNSLGIRYPPSLQSDRAAWDCRDFGRGSIHVLACIRR